MTENVEIYSTSKKSGGKLHLSSHTCPKVRAGRRKVTASASTVYDALQMFTEDRFCADCLSYAQTAIEGEAEAAATEPEAAEEVAEEPEGDDVEADEDEGDDVETEDSDDDIEDSEEPAPEYTDADAEYAALADAESDGLAEEADPAEEGEVVEEGGEQAEEGGQPETEPVEADAAEEPGFVQIGAKRARLGEQVVQDELPEGVTVRWIAPDSWRGVRDYALFTEGACIGLIQVKGSLFRAFCRARGRNCVGQRESLAQAVRLIHAEHVIVNGRA